ncbi:MAG: 50S ribosomal protein L16, partial [Bacilli bacterium]
MLMPKRTKFRRPHRVSYEGKAKGAKKIDFGTIGLMAQQGTWLTQAQIEAARVAMTRYMKREGQVWIRIFPHIPQTKKPLAVRMGGGKGNPEGYVAVV